MALDRKRKLLLSKKWDAQIPLSRKKLRQKVFKQDIPIKIKEAIINEYYWGAKEKYLNNLLNWIRRTNKSKNQRQRKLSKDSQKMTSRTKQISGKPIFQFIPTEKQLEELIERGRKRC